MHCKNEMALCELANCARTVTEAVMQLLDNVKASDEQIINQSTSNLHNSCSNLQNGNGIGFNGTVSFRQDEIIEKFFIATDCLFTSMGILLK